MKHSLRPAVGIRLIATIIPLLITSCKKTMDDYPLANLRAISSFDIEYYHNSSANIFIHHKGVIDETNRYITVSVPTDADLTCLRPSIKLSPWTSCNPSNLEEVDFSNGEVVYEVTAQSGKKAYYNVLITPDFVYEDAILLRLYLCDIPLSPTDITDSDDPTAGRSVTPNAYTDGSELIMLLESGSGYDLSTQRTHLDLSASSHRCMIEVAENNDETAFRTFNDMDVINYTDTVIFRLTAENGKSVRYKVIVKEKEEEAEP